MPQYQGVWNLAQHAQALASQQWATDPLFDYTTLLLQADGAGTGEQNNTFLDSSSNSFTITRNGNTTQGTFSPFSLQPGEWGAYFDGTGDFLTMGGQAAFQFGTGDWTIEFWIYHNSVSPVLYDTRPTGTSSTSGQIVIYLSSGVLKFDTAATNAITGPTLAQNTWYHVAVCKASGSTRMFVNGVQYGNTYSDSVNYTCGASRPIIGADGNSTAASNYTGYLSNLRVLKGTGLYTSAFTPSTTPLTNITNTSLLALQSNRFVDNSSNAFTINVAGNTATQAFSPFAPQYQYTPTVTGGSGYFDGTGDYLGGTITAVNNTTMTMECWVYNLAFDNTNGNHYVQIDNGANTNYLLSHNGNGSARFLSRNNTGGAIFDLASATGALKLNQWQHVVGVRNASAASLYVDGVRVATVSSPSVSSTDGTTLYVGTNAATGRYLTGYVSSARIVSGTAVYDPTLSTLTVPTAPLTNITNTRLLLNFTNAGILDGTMKNNLETVGNAQVSTGITKYGSGSMYFDGTGDYLVVPMSPNMLLRANDFTIEGWFNTTTIGATNGTIFHLYGPTADNLQIYRATANLRVGWRTSGTTITVLTGATSLATNTWYHFAVVRSAGVLYMYINGVLDASGAITGDFDESATTVKVYVGANQAAGEGFSGGVDEIRVTKFARYTRNFVPPQVALPRQ